MIGTIITAKHRDDLAKFMDNLKTSVLEQVDAGSNIGVGWKYHYSYGPFINHIEERFCSGVTFSVTIKPLQMIERDKIIDMPGAILDGAVEIPDEGDHD